MGGRVRAYQVFAAVFLGIVTILIAVFFVNGLYRFKATSAVIWLIEVLAVAVAVMVLVVRRRTASRDRMARSFYLSNEGIYNFEMGYAPLSRIEGSDDASRFVAFAANSLVEMEYGFDVTEPPESFKPTLLIDTAKFASHRPGGGESGGAVIDCWSGRLLAVGAAGSEKDRELLGTFGNARELAILLEDQEPFA